MAVVERSATIYEGSRIPSPIPTVLQVDPEKHDARRHPHRQLRAEPPVHARRAASRRRPRRREGRRHLGGDRLSPHRLREDDGAEDVVEVHHVPGADRLRLVPGERARLRARDREAARDRGAAQGDMDADVPRRADADPLAPRLARHLGARARCDLDVLVHVRRPRRDRSTSSRWSAARGCTPATSRPEGSPRTSRQGFYDAGPRVLQEDGEGDRRLRDDPRPQRDLARAHEGHRPPLGRRRDRARSVGPGAARLRASTGTSASDKPYLAYDEVDFDVPVYPEGDVYARYRVHMDEMRESVRIIAQCLDRLEEMEGEPWIADDRKVVLPPRARAAHLDGVADPPLQDRHRGLHRARGRDLPRASSRPAASSAATSSRTAARSRGA